jgi:cytochrome P450
MLGSLDRWAIEMGDVYRLGIPGRTTWVVNRPEEIERILLHPQYFTKDIDFQRTRPAFGDGLSLSEGEAWKKQRRMMQPAFHKERVAAYGQRMVDLTDQTLSTWRPGEVRDVHRDAMTLTLHIVADSLFGDNEVSTADVQHSLELGLARFDGATALLPGWLPLPVMARFRQAVARLDQVVYDVIARRRQHKSERNDLLSILMHAQDDDGGHMTEAQLRSEVLNLLTAGHETSANALAWTWHQLAQNPDVERKVLDEVDALSGPPTVADLKNLPYLEAVVQESLRLYPPVWGFGRCLVERWEIAGYPAEPGLDVKMFVWVVQRDPRYFPEPLRFRPERWLDGSLESLPAYAYFPFGGGQRLCIGRAFALLETSLILASVARRYRLRSAAGHEVVPVASITLRPRGGLPMQVEAR